MPSKSAANNDRASSVSRQLAKAGQRLPVGVGDFAPVPPFTEHGAVEVLAIARVVVGQDQVTCFGDLCDLPQLGRFIAAVTEDHAAAGLPHVLGELAEHLWAECVSRAGVDSHLVMQVSLDLGLHAECRVNRHRGTAQPTQSPRGRGFVGARGPSGSCRVRP